MSRLVLFLWIFLCVPVSGLLQTTEKMSSPHPCISGGENPEVLLVELKSGIKSSPFSFVKTILARWYVLVPILLAAFFIAILLLTTMCILRRKRAKSGQYSSPDDLESGCMKKDEKRELRQQLTQFLMSSDTDGDEDELPKQDPGKGITEDSQPNPMNDPELSTRKPSSFKPVDTEMQDSVGSQRNWDHCSCGLRCCMCQQVPPREMSEPENAILTRSHQEAGKIVFYDSKVLVPCQEYYHEFSSSSESSDN